MEDFTLVDAGAAAIVFISAILAYSRGFVREILSIAAWGAASIVAFYFAGDAVPFVLEIPYLKDVISGSCDFTVLAAAFLVFAGTLIIFAIFTPLFAGAVQRSALSGFDQGLGFLFGVARGVLLILAALVAYNFVGLQLPIVEQSKTAQILASAQLQVEAAIENDSEDGSSSIVNWGQERYAELTASCQETKDDENKTVLPTVSN